MARQRFIWPTIWDDPDLGRLTSDARLLYIACFSLADDQGRILGDPTYLKTQAFRYRERVTGSHIEKLLDELTGSCASFHRYEVDGSNYIAFLNWDEFQKPKYPKPSKLPAPPGKRSRRKPAPRSQKPSGKASETLPEASPIGLGWDGLGREDPSFHPELQDVEGGKAENEINKLRLNPLEALEAAR
jgi:hypothetical protein